MPVNVAPLGLVLCTARIQALHFTVISWRVPGDSSNAASSCGVIIGAHRGATTGKRCYWGGVPPTVCIEHEVAECEPANDHDEQLHLQPGGKMKGKSVGWGDCKGGGGSTRE